MKKILRLIQFSLILGIVVFFVFMWIRVDQNIDAFLHEEKNTFVDYIGAPLVAIVMQLSKIYGLCVMIVCLFIVSLVFFFIEREENGIIDKLILTISGTIGCLFVLFVLSNLISGAINGNINNTISPILYAIRFAFRSAVGLPVD